MKQVLIDRYGTPWEVARCADVPDVGEPAADEVVFDVLAFPINPADMWFCKGSYRLKPPLPTTPGAECVGRVTSVGSAVTHLKKGDLVINLQRENWAQKRRVKGDDAIPLPAGIDLRQAAMVRINPPTAQLMLQDFVDLKPGEWVIQNVANSAVGRLLIVLAKQRGLRTVNVVRRPELDAELKSLGADLVVVDGDDLAARVAKGTGEAAIRLGIEAIGGAASLLQVADMTGMEQVVARNSSMVVRARKAEGVDLIKMFASKSSREGGGATLSAEVVAAAAGVPVKVVNKVKDGRPHIVDMVKAGEIQLVFTTVDETRTAIADSRHIRQAALANRVTYYTSMAGCEAAVEGMKHQSGLAVKSLQELHAELH